MFRLDGLASVNLRLERGGVAASIVGGVITHRSLGDVYAETARQLDGACPLVFLADFRRAVWALTVDELSSFFAGAGDAVFAPAALIVSPADVPMMREHAYQVAQLGVIRKVFTCPKRARAWVDLELDIQRHPRRSLGSPAPGASSLGL